MRSETAEVKGLLPAPPLAPAPVRMRLQAQGTVQGVGFRPFVYNLATACGLAGSVYNAGEGVVIELEGAPADCARFRARFENELPPLAHLETLQREILPPMGLAGFRIEPSRAGGRRFTLISPDIATCPACLAELRDPANRRHRHPFINCTHCGPRFTLIRDIPYDRARTTMEAFAMCEACEREYRDPANRRFHAEPTACPACGPRLALLNATGKPLPGQPLKTAARLLGAGAILAVKGLGGYHLACDAMNATAVADLRRRKKRDDKPFALMAASLEQVRTFCRVGPEEARLLTAPERPIVLLPRLAASAVAEGVAPGFRELGVMLAYTPLHHLLLGDSGLVLVMTSGNWSDEPIAYRDEEALKRLEPLVDGFLTHDRPIHVRCDDSVLRPGPGGAQFLRRSRGYVPAPIALHRKFPRAVLACGGELKNTFCLVRGGHAFLSHHIGDLENQETYQAFQAGVEHFQRLFQIEPEVIAHDLHPDYLSTRFALDATRAAKGALRRVPVQHHHAHVAAAMADNGLEGPVIGVAYDGTGYGDDGHLWGGEVVIAHYGGFRRAAHWEYFPLPGGAKAIREPWRVAQALLEAAFGDEAWGTFPALLPGIAPAARRTVARMMERGLNAPLSSGVGRLFDAAAALLTGRHRVSYEGQAAMELEQLTDREGAGAFPLELPHLPAPGTPWLLPSAGLMRAVAEGKLRGETTAVLGAKFHNTLAETTAEVCAHLGAREGLHRVVLSGGVFQNTLLLGRTVAALERRGMKAFTHHRVPANDGGLSLGQAMVAGALTCA